VECDAAVLAWVQAAAAAAAVTEASQEGVQVGLYVHTLTAQLALRQGEDT
jgi:hypothetical protein